METGEKPEKPLWSKALPFIMGGGSAIISKTLTAPFERVQIILQTQHLKPPEMRYNGFTGAMTGIPKREGFLSFWRGNAINVARYFPTQALAFAFNDIFQKILKPDAGSSTKSMAFRSILCGGLAGGCSLLVMYPLEFVRTRLSADVGHSKERLYNGFFDALRKTVKSEGVLGLYRGVWASFWMFVPYRGIYFGGFTTLKSMYLSDPAQNSFMKRWAISQFVTTAAQTAIYPLDTVRRRLMLSGEARPGAEAAPRYRSTLHCFTTVIREEGVRPLYNGFGVNLLRSIGGGLCLAFYDTLYSIMKEKGHIE
eukprot:TRINITY_DN9112_c0_g1_i1.p1 TRINITY_DN9112_c0_g1~~TRINITY_DN9112_c0_g1_i1.p1  ORF type:complete len:318 (+),score=28.42 TRINITY_DN9112_c0_g1_i1:27-956(+)